MLDFIGKKLIEKRLKQCPLCKRHTVLFVGETTAPYTPVGRAYIKCLRCSLTLYSDMSELTEQAYVYGHIKTKVVDDLIDRWNSIGLPEKSENGGEDYGE